MPTVKKVLSKQIQRNRINFVRSTLMIKKISQLGSYLSQFLSSLPSHHPPPTISTQSGGQLDILLGHFAAIQTKIKPR